MLSSLLHSNKQQHSNANKIYNQIAKIQINVYSWCSIISAWRQADMWLSRSSAYIWRNSSNVAAPGCDSTNSWRLSQCSYSTIILCMIIQAVTSYMVWTFHVLAGWRTIAHELAPNTRSSSFLQDSCLWANLFDFSVAGLRTVFISVT
jgi:hypothetical protein